jgi:IS30 family transposase
MLDRSERAPTEFADSKGTDFSTIANAEVAKVERLLIARPRKSLGFRSPQEVFDSLTL